MIIAGGMVVLVISNRGQTILDMLLVIVMLFIVALGSLFGYKILSEMNSDIQDDDDIAQVAKDDLNGLTTNYPQFMDNAFVLMLALLWVALIVTAFLVDSHPVFFIITVVLLVFVFIVAMIISNAYQDVRAEEELVDASSGFPMTNWVFDNLLVIVIAMGFTSAIALYAKARQ